MPMRNCCLVGKSRGAGPWAAPRATVIEASEVVAMDDPVEVALRKKKILPCA